MRFFGFFNLQGHTGRSKFFQFSEKFYAKKNFNSDFAQILCDKFLCFRDTLANLSFFTFLQNLKGGGPFMPKKFSALISLKFQGLPIMRKPTQTRANQLKLTQSSTNQVCALQVPIMHKPKFIENFKKAEQIKISNKIFCSLSWFAHYRYYNAQTKIYSKFQKRGTNQQNLDQNFVQPLLVCASQVPIMRKPNLQ